MITEGQKWASKRNSSKIITITKVTNFFNNDIQKMDAVIEFTYPDADTGALRTAERDIESFGEAYEILYA